MVYKLIWVLMLTAGLPTNQVMAKSSRASVHCFNH